MPANNDAQFGNQMVTILVGPGKQEFTFHKHALATITQYLFCALSPLETLATNSTNYYQADLPDELPETIHAFMNWLYPTFIGFSWFSLPPNFDTVTLFRLYGFAHRYIINDLQDAIVSLLYEKFANTSSLWFVLGTNKPALETLVKEVPSGTHLHRLFVRSLAYSIRLRPEDAWLDGNHHYSSHSSTAATESRVGEVMESVPRELWGPISKEVLLMKMVGDWRQGFVATVGLEMKFLKRYEDLGGSGPSTGWP